MDRDAREAWETVEALNRCWTSGRPEGLREYFHEEMVAITPADRLPLAGREACVSSWAAYARTTRILSWETSEERVRTYGDAAVVTYRYVMRCEREGREFRPSGRDMMVLVKTGDRWMVVADQFSPDPEVKGEQDL